MKFKEELGFKTTPERSALMSKIRGSETKFEIILRKELWSFGIRYRKNFKKLPGSPDIVVTKNKVVIFIDGEFWHGYNWKEKKEKIKANREYWIYKIERNMQRDIENTHALEAMGFKVIRFWEHQVKKELKYCISEILATLDKNI